MDKDLFKQLVGARAVPLAIIIIIAIFAVGLMDHDVVYEAIDKSGWKALSSTWAVFMIIIHAMLMTALMVILVTALWDLRNVKNGQPTKGENDEIDDPPKAG